MNLHRGQGQLYAGMCAGVGLIHFAEDKNPRSVYEGVQAGLPLFISREAKVSQDLESQPFVVVGRDDSRKAISCQHDPVSHRLTMLFAAAVNKLFSLQPVKLQRRIFKVCGVAPQRLGLSNFDMDKE